MSPPDTSRWEALASHLPELLSKLVSASPVRYPLGADVPNTPGVYLFSEAGTPVYVGQTRTLRRRLTQHSAEWARENQATFAFSRARARAREVVSLGVPRTRAELAGHPEFQTLFAAARREVGGMDARYVEVDDPELRTVFEVYATVLLGTENTFETH